MLLSSPQKFRCDSVPDALRAAEWISPLPAYAPLRHVMLNYVREFELADVPTQVVPMWITADASYVLWVNGRYVGRGPARGFQRSWPFDAYDVRELLRPGPNRIAIAVHNPGRSTFRYIHENATGLLCALELGGDRRILSDASWLCRVDPTRSRTTPQLSIQMEDQEHIDNRRGTDAWRGDAMLESATGHEADNAVIDFVGTLGRELRWSAPRQVRAFGAPPWHTVEPRDLPHLTNRIRPYTGWLSEASGKPTLSPRPTPNPAADLFDVAGKLTWRPIAGGDGTVDTPALAAGAMHVAVLDLGEPTIGTLRLQATDTTPGQVVGLVPFELLGSDLQPIMPDPSGECRVAMAVRIVLAGAARESNESFTTFGHRYLAIITHGPCGPGQFRASVRESLYPVEPVGSFKSGDERLNDIYGICQRTQQIAMTDAYIDAWREQAQWWGDARVQFANHQQLQFDDRLLRRGIRQVAGQRLPNGLTYGHVPTAAHTCVLPDFSLVWGLTLVDHWWHTGSTELARQHKADWLKTLGYFENEGRDEHGLLRYDPRYWMFLDWADIPKAGTPTLLNLLFVHTLDRLATLYEAAGDEALVRRLREQEASLRPRVLELLYDADAGLFRDGIDEHSAPRQTHGTHAQCMALLAGFEVSAAMRRSVIDALEVTTPKPSEPSCFWITYVFEAAKKLGLERATVDCIRSRWTAMVPQGSTYEVWQPTPGESRSHAWSAHPLYHLPQLMAGLRSTAPGWARGVFEPMLDESGLWPLSCVVPTKHGQLQLSSRADGEALELALGVPEGIELEVRMPDFHATVGPGMHRWRHPHRPQTVRVPKAKPVAVR